jgi:hypothetical protein
MRTARNVLAKNNVKLAPSVIAKPEHLEGREHWTVKSASRLEVWAGTPGLKGRWSIQVQIIYDTDPGGSSVYIKKGSFGLNWNDDRTARSFLRYDVDVLRQDTIGEPCHLNVLQPDPFGDRLHLRIPGFSITEWELGPTLEFLSSTQLRDEIVARLN